MGKKALLLLSGGIDSPVSGYLMQKLGLEIIALHFSNEPFTDNGPEIKSKKLFEHLHFKKFIVMNISDILGNVAKKCKREYYFIIMKRIMLRKACEVAKAEGCDFIITGDNLAQVSSQTLENMKVISSVSTFEILRPLLTYDKKEIIKIAMTIGTYDISNGPEVCDVLGPRSPATRSKLEKIEKEESRLEF